MSGSSHSARTAETGAGLAIEGHSIDYIPESERHARHGHVSEAVTDERESSLHEEDADSRR